MRPSFAWQANADRVTTILSRLDVRNPGIFSSVAQAEDEDESDLDILVDPGETLTFFDLARLEREQGRRDDAWRIVGRGRRKRGA